MACECCPYGSQGVLIKLQVFSGIVLLMSICGWWMTWIAGIAYFIMIMLLACVKVHLVVVVLAGVLAIIASIGQIIFALNVKTLNVFCDATSPRTSYYYNNNNYGNNDDISRICDIIFTVFLSIGIATAIGWASVAISTFTLLCVLKDKHNRTQNAFGIGVQDLPMTEIKTDVATPLTDSAVVPNPSNVVTTTITELPDGSRRVERSVTNPDGSTTVMVTTELPEANAEAQVEVESQQPEP